MLSVESLDVFHGDAQALDGVSLEVAEGAIVAIVGANGAGKSSLIRTIAGMHRPARGRIVFRGRDIAGWPSHQRNVIALWQPRLRRAAGTSSRMPPRQASPRTRVPPESGC